MDIHTIEKQKMESLETLASTNVQVGKVKATLLELKDNETVYIKEREAKVLAQIQTVIDDSEKVLSEAFENYKNIQDLSIQSAEFATFLTEAHAEFKELQELFTEQTKAWNERVKSIEDGFAEMQKDINVDKVQIKNAYEALESRKKELKLERRVLKDERGTLERAITRLKENVI